MLNLDVARKIISESFDYGRANNLKPLSVVVLDAGGHVIAFERGDGASPGRFEIARGKAYGCIMLGMTGSAIQARAEAQAFFINAVNGAYNGQLIPVKGGVLLYDTAGAVIGAIGITGDTSDNDAEAALAGAKAAGLNAQA